MGSGELDGRRRRGVEGTEEQIVVAGLVLAVVLIGGLLVFAWAERRAATGHPIQLPSLPRIDAHLPLHGRGVLWGLIAIVFVSALIIVVDLAVLELLH